MEKQAIKLAAITAIADLQLDCEVKEVRSSTNGDGWCVQFSGEYGQFCDEFKNQFGRENAPEIMREKIKGHLIKQIAKIRSKTGKARRPRAEQSGKQSSEDMLGAPLKMLGEVFGNASQLVGAITGQAANVAAVARDFTANMTEEIGPAAVMTESSSEPETKKPRKRASSGKRAKKAGKVATKSSGKARKASTKKSKKTEKGKR